MKKFEPSKKPLNNEKIVISIRMKESQLKKIDELAGKTDISRNEFINQCIEYALSNLESNDIAEKNEKGLSSIS